MAGIRKENKIKPFTHRRVRKILVSRTPHQFSKGRNGPEQNPSKVAQGEERSGVLKKPAAEMLEPSYLKVVSATDTPQKS